MLFTMRETYVDRNPKSHKVLGIALVAIIDRQLLFEYTITSRSTDVVVMALPSQNINHLAYRSMFKREKISRTNFNEWLHRLKLVFRVEMKMFVIEHPIPPAPATDSEANVFAEWNAVYDAYNEVAYLMLRSMTPKLHKQFENYSPYDMLQELKSMFEKQAEVERFDLIQSFHACKQEEGKSVADYVLKMKGYVEQLEREIHAMFIEYEKGLPKKAETPQVMMIKSGKIQKANKKSLNAKGKNKVNGKGKDKKVYIPKPNNPKPTAKERPAKDDACHHCKEVGHWKRNCPVYLAELQKKRKQVGSASSSGIFTIELFSFPNNNSWVYDTGCGTNICITKQGFRIERKLKQGALYLYVGNGVRAQVEAIGSFDLVLPNGLVICLDNCHYAPTITRGVVSVSCLVDNGFVQCFTDYEISVSKNDVLYFNAVARNGIYEIDMHDLVSNGYVFILNGGAVDWKSSKQSTIAMSATESEYIAASEAPLPEGSVRLGKDYLKCLCIVPTINEPLNMYYDNSAAIHYANEPGFRKAPDTIIEDIIMFASVLNLAK
ncbi:retrotransposon protein, putative, ty1-copia subclass [Tanacetum coccineum]